MGCQKWHYCLELSDHTLLEDVRVCVCVASAPVVAVLESQTWLPLSEGTEPTGGCKVQGRVCVCVCVSILGARQKPEVGFHLQLPFRSNIETRPLYFLKYLKNPH